MGLGPVKNGQQQVITPRDGKAWCDVVNATPMSTPTPAPAEKPATPSGSYLWLDEGAPSV